MIGQFRKVTAIVLLTISSIACVPIGQLQHTKIEPSENPRKGVINVDSRATGVPKGSTGMLQFLFIPIANTRLEGDSSASIMKSVREAVKAAGYNANKNPAYTAIDAAYLKTHVKKIKFGNFLALNTANIVLHHRLVSREGALLWEGETESWVSSSHRNYDRTAESAMNEQMSEMIELFSSEAFYQATLRISEHNKFLEEPNEKQSVKQSNKLDPKAP